MQKNLLKILFIIILSLFFFVALFYFLKPKGESQQLTYYHQQVKFYNNFLKDKNYPKAIETAKKLNRFSQSIQNDTLTGITYDLIGDVFDITEANDSALYYHSNAYKFYFKSNNAAYYSKTCNQLGLNYLRKGKLNEAQKYFIDAIYYNNYARVNKNYIIYHNLGCVYYQKNSYADAINEFHQSYNCYPNNDKKRLNYFYLLVNLALSYIHINNLNLAEQYIKEIKIIQNNFNQAFPQAYLFKLYAEYNYKKNNIDSAKYYVYKSIRLYEEKGYNVNANEVRIFLAKMLLNVGDYENAKMLLDKVFNYFSIVYENQGFLANIYSLYADFYLKNNDYKKSISNANLAIDIAKKLNDYELISKNYEKLYTIYSKLNDIKATIDNIKQYNIYKDSVNFINQQNKIYELEKNFLLSKKEKELQYLNSLNKQNKKNITFISIIGFILILLIILILFLYKKLLNKTQIISNQKDTLQQQNTDLDRNTKELQLKNEKILQLNALKDTMFSTIGHDLKNPFNLVLNFAYLMKNDKNLNEKDDKRINAILIATKQAYDLLDNLLQWSKMQSENIYVNIEEININIIIRDIINYYEQNSNLKNITIQQDFSDDITINTDKNMFSAIIRNVINNAIKFSPQNSVINIDVKKNNNHAKIFIKDFGIGISQNIKDKILIRKVEKSEDGTLDEKGSGFGYYLINFFVDKLGYEFKIYDNVPHGTIFELSCPLS